MSKTLFFVLLSLIIFVITLEDIKVSKGGKSQQSQPLKEEKEQSVEKRHRIPSPEERERLIFEAEERLYDQIPQVIFDVSKLGKTEHNFLYAIPIAERHIEELKREAVDVVIVREYPLFNITLRWSRLKNKIFNH